MAGRFEIFVDEAGKHRFRLKSSSGQVLVVGDACESKEQCMKGIETIRKLAPYAEVEDVAAAGA